MHLVRMIRAAPVLVLSFLVLFSCSVIAQGSNSTTSSQTSTGALPQVTGINVSIPLCAALSCRYLLSQDTAQCPNATLRCLCNSTSFQADAAHCIKTSCTDPTDQQNAYQYAVEACAEANVTLPPINEIGQANAAASLRVEYWIAVGVVMGTLLGSLVL